MNIYNNLNIDINILSKSELRIHNFINDNLSNITDITVNDIIDNCYTTRSTVDRYMKKINIDGFKEFKFICENTVSKDSKEINEFCEVLKKYKNKTILVAGFGGSFISAQYLARRLTLLNYNIHAQNISEIYGMHINYDVIIFISNSGNIKYLSDILEKCEKKLLLAITSNNSVLSNKVKYYIDNSMQNKYSNLYDHDNQMNNFIVIEKLYDKLSSFKN